MELVSFGEYYKEQKIKDLKKRIAKNNKRKLKETDIEKEEEEKRKKVKKIFQQQEKQSIMFSEVQFPSDCLINILSYCCPFKDKASIDRVCSTFRQKNKQCQYSLLTIEGKYINTFSEKMELLFADYFKKNIDTSKLGTIIINNSKLDERIPCNVNKAVKFINYDGRYFQTKERKFILVLSNDSIEVIVNELNTKALVNLVWNPTDWTDTNGVLDCFEVNKSKFDLFKKDYAKSSIDHQFFNSIWETYVLPNIFECILRYCKFNKKSKDDIISLLKQTKYIFKKENIKILFDNHYDLFTSHRISGMLRLFHIKNNYAIQLLNYIIKNNHIEYINTFEKYRSMPFPFETYSKLIHHNNDLAKQIIKTPEVLPMPLRIDILNIMLNDERNKDMVSKFISAFKKIQFDNIFKKKYKKY